MRVFNLAFVIVALMLFSSSIVIAQTPADPSGRWEGLVHLPNQTLTIEINLAKNARGDWDGTFGELQQGIKALPLASVSVENRAVKFLVKGSDEGSLFSGTLAADGKSLTGDIAIGGMTIPFELSRTGEAKIAAAPKSPAIPKDLEGTWSGAIGGRLRLIVKMVNQADGTASGTIVSPDGSDKEIPMAIALKGSRVMLDVDAVGGMFVGDLNAAAGELTGTWSQATTSAPLTLTRVK